jgi:hypothetical protein
MKINIKEKILAIININPSMVNGWLKGFISHPVLSCSLYLFIHPKTE